MAQNIKNTQFDLQKQNIMNYSQVISNDLQSYKLAKFVSQNNKIRCLNLDIIEISEKSKLILQQAFSLVLSVENLQTQIRKNEDLKIFIDLFQNQSLDIESIKILKLTLNSFVISQDLSNKLCNFIDSLRRLSSLTLIVELQTPCQFLQSLENSLQSKRLKQLKLFLSSLNIQLTPQKIRKQTIFICHQNTHGYLIYRRLKQNNQFKKIVNIQLLLDGINDLKYKYEKQIIYLFIYIQCNLNQLFEYVNYSTPHIKILCIIYFERYYGMNYKTYKKYFNFYFSNKNQQIYFQFLKNQFLFYFLIIFFTNICGNQYKINEKKKQIFDIFQQQYLKFNQYNTWQFFQRIQQVFQAIIFIFYDTFLQITIQLQKREKSPFKLLVQSHSIIYLLKNIKYGKLIENQQFCLKQVKQFLFFELL
ncbi:transmembrane protein, putative (macronuclear) [Tetrahymena thermophila SB210]|uniref:Transmembrane protein, putative n=1 Tax=Tetrahymena thermophila (strain SB210) TaxID=312017 RepID=Q22EH3_TETTS|nr:transmembrane protein, putative [Tetrahymena thermophila SB210]EAR83679.2 transmembrane protein, putative [Tetrahymena thermophila SB210]|eukprot:XP_001031342.2 transmembrane protein, putative [Tetrahymena thermophila SB210]